tara:strand:- start:233 stop:973 length:741 start_codon:yes stop_codon:yes gene_type:complete
MKTILVTGTNKGIGLEFARQYLNEGFKVIATCRNLSNLDGLNGLVNSFPDKISIFQMELLDEKSIEDFALKIKDIPIDIFINNAGVTFGYSRNAKLSNTGISLNKLNAFGNIETENWLPIFKANCIAPLLLTQLLYKNIMLGKEKKMVFISSKPASISENTGGSMYMSRSSRSALNQVIKSLSIDLIGEGISVASISPGWVKTDSGGLNALIDVNTSVTGIRNVIDNLSIKNSGKFWDYNGNFIPW